MIPNNWTTREVPRQCLFLFFLTICVLEIVPVVVQSISVWLFVTPWTAARQASLSLAISQSLPKFMFIALVMPSSQHILWRPLILLPSIFPIIKDFSNESSVHIRWPKYWSFNFSISPSSEYSGLISLKIGLVSLLSKGLSGVFSSTTVQMHQFFGVLPSLQSSSHSHTWSLYGPLSAEWCRYFSTHCLGLSSLSCQEAIVLWFHGCSLTLV